MLFGDWGTSRLYVLGLAFFYSGFAAPWHVLGVCTLMMVVGWAYTIVCRCFQDGGGVYSSAKATHQQVALLGAYLLFADYVVTAALSTVEAFRYFGASAQLAPLLAVPAILLIAVINFIGPRHAGRLATYVALLTLVMAVITALFCLPHLSFSNITGDHRPWSARWPSFVHIVLALSGVEAIANMTGVMVTPVQKTARRAIWVVLAEVVILNLLFAVAMTNLPGLPSDVLATRDPATLGEHEHALRDTMIRVIASHYVHPVFGTIASVVFGLLLLSATNTAMGGMISVQYVMGRDREMPDIFTRLNAFGVPWLGIVTSTFICSLVILVQGDVEKLAHLYAIGVVGAITLNLGSTCINRHVAVKTWERAVLAVIVVFLAGVEFTIAYEKPEAAVFAGLVILGGYTLRAGVKKAPALKPYIPKVTGAMAKWFEAPQLAADGDILSSVGIIPFDPGKPKILVATRGNPELLKFAAEEAEARGANLLVLYVREMRLAFGTPSDEKIRVEDDAEAVPIFVNANQLAREFKIPLMPIYCVAASASEMILDFAGTYGVDFVIMGVTRRGTLFRALRGDLITAVAAGLPPDTKLLIHA